MNFFTMTYIVDYHNVDRYHDLTAESLMQIFGRVSSYHEVLGYRLKPGYMAQWDMTWILYQWKIRVFQPKQFARKMKLHTLAILRRDMYCYRYYLIEDMEGNDIARGVAQWVAVDTKKRRIARVPPPLQEILAQESDLSPEEKERIMAIDMEPLRRRETEFEFELKIPVLWSDIDSNMHVNNSVYGKWVIETMHARDPHFLEKNYHKAMDIVYKKEKKPDGHVLSRVHLEGDTSWHEILDEEGNLLTLIHVQWTDKDTGLGDYSDYDIDAMLD